MTKIQKIKDELDSIKNSENLEGTDEALDIISSRKESLLILYRKSYYEFFSIFLYKYFLSKGFNIDRRVFFKKIFYRFGIFSPLYLYIIMLSLTLLINLIIFLTIPFNLLLCALQCLIIFIVFFVFGFHCLICNDSDYYIPKK